ncbi:hypothetical protein [Novosphingobium guangzhouense]|uniref:DUF4350 domain-containing protein n=1 Tax=Novosphingobium guangzhouense TaxID=1850347 RepID=A0A2K2FSW2_9SPHN|nr:hypothetical protein [Novosphingobium guangzhouense]PNU01858.1 hypothetical protein A8V01_27220 [Novosphingobium guangzhouense]
MSTRPKGAEVGANPFSLWAVLAIVVLGALLFVALLWMIGTGIGMGTANDGKAHVEGKGLNGYAAMADYLERRGFAVEMTRNPGALERSGLLVLTPPAIMKGKDIDKIVRARRYIGPTLVIVPKWQAMRPIREQRDKAKKGWVRLGGAGTLEWPGFFDEISVATASARNGRATWAGAGLSGTLPDGKVVMSGAGTRLVRIVAGAGQPQEPGQPQEQGQPQEHGRTLAGFMDDGGSYQGLEAIALDRVLHSGEDDQRFPVVFVFEPDLLDNYGMARFENAQLAEALVRATGVERGGAVVFDMTLPGYGRAQNLLTLAFTPPFLAATLCLLLAAVAVGWRAFLRFGPPLVPERAIAFGKRALVSNAAGLVRRTRRFHLLGPPYADRVRERLIAALGLPRALHPDEADAAIDAAVSRALAARGAQGEPFSVLAARLRAAGRPHDLLKAARDLHALERTLTR